MIWRRNAPSNIALIKYMGKSNVENNVAAHRSLSITLPHLITTVELEIAENSDRWEPLEKNFHLNEAGQHRIYTICKK